MSFAAACGILDLRKCRVGRRNFEERPMGSLLIAVIYLAFISLGLPDSLLGSAWPVMRIELGASVSYAGIVTMIISVFTIISALLTDKLVAKLGTGLVVAISVLLTACAMAAFSFATAFWQLCIFALPYGLGAGAIDTSLNNYAAKYLSSKHMNWLHCCWGIGAAIGPYIMGYCLTGESAWRGGYRIIAAVQAVITLLMFISVPLWKRMQKTSPTLTDMPESEDDREVPLAPWRAVRLRGVVFACVAALLYFSIEQLPIVWASTYFTDVYALKEDTAAFLASMFYIGITLGRIVSGFVAGRAGDRLLIRIGLATILCFAVLIALPLPSWIPAAAGFIAVGFGCGPVYPCLLHSVPINFGRRHSGSVIGVIMAFSYFGMTFTPIAFGKLAEATTIRLLPFGVIVLALLVFAMTELMNRLSMRPSEINEQ